MLLEDPFEEAWKPDWVRIGSTGSVLQIDNNNFFQGKSALRARRVIEPPNGIAHLQYTVANTPKVLCIAGAVRIDERGMGEVDFFGVDAPANVPQQSIGLVHSAARGAFVLQYPGEGGLQQVPVELPLKTWIPVTFEIDLGGTIPMVKTKVGANPPRDFSLDKEWPRASIVAQVGIYFAGTGTTEPTDDWVIRYDQVRIAVVDR